MRKEIQFYTQVKCTIINITVHSSVDDRLMTDTCIFVTPRLGLEVSTDTPPEASDNGGLLSSRCPAATCINRDNNSEFRPPRRRRKGMSYQSCRKPEQMSRDNDKVKVGIDARNEA